ncbi:phage holin family protein, partial [Bacillus thuringiensis]
MERVHDIFRSLNIIDVFNSTTFKLGSLVGGGLGTFLSIIYGKSNLIWICILMMVVTLDWITGSKASKLDGSYSSAYGVEGIARTVVLFLLPCLAHMFDIA